MLRVRAAVAGGAIGGEHTPAGGCIVSTRPAPPLESLLGLAELEPSVLAIADSARRVRAWRQHRPERSVEEAVRARAADAWAAAGHPDPAALWSALAPAPPEWPDVPDVPAAPEPDALPLDVLPAAIREHVESVADATQTPPDLGLILALSCLSATVRGRATVKVDSRGWEEALCIYAAGVLPPASRKSAVYAAMTRPLVEWEATQRELIGPSYRRARDLADVAAQSLAAAKAAAAKRNGSLDEVQQARAVLDKAEKDVPLLPQIVASDATPEALVRLLSEQGGAAALLGPEADPLGIADGRYSDTARVDELLRAWSGEPITVNRVSREPIHIPRACLTIGICLQPAALDALRHGKVHRGRGLWGRILWCMPPHGLGTRKTGSEVPPLDLQAAAAYAAVLRNLLDAGNAASVPSVLTFTQDALHEIYAYEAEVERGLADGGRLAGIRDWAGKVCGQAVRVAALLELASRAANETAPSDPWAPIERAATAAAVRLTRALTTHALATLGGLRIDPHLEALDYVLRRARELPPGATLRDLHRACDRRDGTQTMDELTPLVEELESRGCLRRVEQRRDGPGRPQSPLLELHPALRPARHAAGDTIDRIPLSGRGTADTVGIVPLSPPSTGAGQALPEDLAELAEVGVWPG
jgi:replicative DNA helicase